MRSKLFVFVALVAGLVVVAGGTAGGGVAPLPPITVDPETGNPGTTFTVSGEGCFFADVESEGSAGMSAGDLTAAGPLFPPVEVTIGFPTPLVQTTIAAGDGTWSIELTVPAGTPPGTYPVTADCQNEVPPPLSASADVGAAQLYPPGATFTVTAPVTPITPAPLPLVPAPAPLTPAPAVAGTPQFTG